eukprot:scaffold81391_cov44-Tisochrysis_lutea.AAC.3
MTPMRTSLDAEGIRLEAPCGAPLVCITKMCWRCALPPNRVNGHTPQGQGPAQRPSMRPLGPRKV